MDPLWVTVDVSDTHIASCIATYLLRRETAHRLMVAHDDPVSYVWRSKVLVKIPSCFQFILHRLLPGQLFAVSHPAYNFDRKISAFQTFLRSRGSLQHSPGMCW